MVASKKSLSEKRIRDVLAALERDELLEAVDAYGLEVADRRRRDQLIEALLQCRAFRLDEWLEGFYRERLKEICRELGLDDSGRAIADIVQRLVPSGSDRGDPAPSVTPPASGVLERRESHSAKIRFVEMMIDQLTARGVMAASALYEPPFTSLHAEGPDALFGGKENVIEGIFEKLKAVHSELIEKAG